MAEEKITQNTEVVTTEVATVLGVTGRRVQQLIQDGVISTISRGKMYLADAVQEYIQFITRNLPDEEDAKIEKSKKKAEVQLKASKALVAKLEAEELQGKMHRSDDVEAITSDMIFAVRSALLALPGRLAVDCAASTTAAETAQIIRKEIFKVMNELSEHKYDPEKYKELVRERMEWEPSEREDE